MPPANISHCTAVSLFPERSAMKIIQIIMKSDGVPALWVNPDEWCLRCYKISRNNIDIPTAPQRLLESSSVRSLMFFGESAPSVPLKNAGCENFSCSITSLHGWFLAIGVAPTVWPSVWCPFSGGEGGSELVSAVSAWPWAANCESVWLWLCEGIMAMKPQLSFSKRPVLSSGGSRDCLG